MIAGAAPAAAETLDVTLRLVRPPDIQLAPALENGPGEQWFCDGPAFILRRLLPSLESWPLWQARYEEEKHAVSIHIHPCHRHALPAGAVVHSPLHYPLDQQLLMLHLVRNGLLLHAAGGNIHGMGCVFLGVSGAGKTTLCRSLESDPAVELFSDDRIIVRRREYGWALHGTPWPGDARIARNRSVPLRALFFIRPGSATRLHPLKPATALERLLPVTSLLWFAPGPLQRQLDSCERLVREIPAFDLDVFLTDDPAGRLAAALHDMGSEGRV